MKLETRLRTSVAAVALALSAGAWAMTPLDQSNRGPYSPQGSSMTQDDFGNEVHSRDFSGTYELENSGRGSSLSMEGSSARIQGDENSASGNSWNSSNNGSSQSIEDEAAANQDAFDWPAAGESAPSTGDQLSGNPADTQGSVSSDVAGSGYTSDSDLTASSGEGTQEDQLVVIVPEDWEGSVPDLVAAIEQSSDDSALVVIDGEASGDDASSNVPDEVPPSYPE